MHILVKTMIKLLSFINWSMFRTVSHQFSDTMMVLVAASKVSKNWKSIDWNVSVLVSCYLGPFPTTRARPTTPPVTGALNLPWTTQNLCSWLFIFPPGHSGWMYTKAGLPPPTLPTHPQLHISSVFSISTTNYTPSEIFQSWILCTDFSNSLWDSFS